MAGQASGRGKGLDEEQVQQIDSALTEGGRPPKVALRESSSGLPAGTVGTVVRLADRGETDEFVIVRVNGDELPFTPAELVPPPPRARRVKADPPQLEQPPGEQPSGEESSAVPHRPDPSPTVPVAQPEGARAGRRSRQEPARRAAGKRGPVRLSVQLRYDERGWTVEATRGARVVVKPTQVRPAAALQVAELLDNDHVRQVVSEIADVEREEAERRASELRSQLAEVEAVLAGYDQP